MNDTVKVPTKPGIAPAVKAKALAKEVVNKKPEVVVKEVEEVAKPLTIKELLNEQRKARGGK